MGGGEKLPGRYMGQWGDFGAPPQKGITLYAISPNRQNPLAGTLHAAIFNTARRTRGQILYWSIPMLLGYYAMEWAQERNEYLNSKPGRARYAAGEDE